MTAPKALHRGVHTEGSVSAVRVRALKEDHGPRGRAVRGSLSELARVKPWVGGLFHIGMESSILALRIGLDTLPGLGVLASPCKSSQPPTFPCDFSCKRRIEKKQFCASVV